MECVRATPGNHIRYRATSATEFRAVGVRENRDFAVSFLIVGLKCLTSNRIIIIILTIDQEIVPPRARSIHAKLQPIRPEREVAVISIPASHLVAGGNTSFRQNYRNWIQIRVWEVLDLFITDVLADFP